MAMVRAEWLHRLVNHAQHIDGALAPTIAMPTLKEIEQRLARALPPSTPLEELLLRSVAAKSYLEALTLRRGAAAATGTGTDDHGPAYLAAELVRTDYSPHLTLASIARRVGHQPERLNRLFHRIPPLQCCHVIEVLNTFQPWFAKHWHSYQPAYQLSRFVSFALACTRLIIIST